TSPARPAAPRRTIDRFRALCSVWRFSHVESVVFAADGNGGFKEPGLAAAVVAYAVVAVGEDFALLEQGGDAVGELDFAADALLGVPQAVEDFRFEYVAADHGEVGGGVFRSGFFDDGRNLFGAHVDGVAGDDAVFVGVFVGDFLYAQYAAALCMRCLYQLAGDGDVSVDEVVGQQYGEGFVADDGGGTQYGVAQAEGSRLA